MPKITVRSIDGDCEARGGDDVAMAGPVEARAVLAGPRDPIHVHSYALSPGGSLRWTGAMSGHGAYVLDGSVVVGGVEVARGGAFFVEHGGSALAVAGPAGGRIVVFNQVPDPADPPTRAGGHLHILPPDRVPRGTDLDGRGMADGALYADAGCETCELWLHENSLHDPTYSISLHCHSEDEVILVTAGSARLGTREGGPGTVVAVAKQTLYSLGVGPNGLTFINFRPHSPVAMRAGQPPMDERAVFRRKIAAPDYVPAAASA